MGWILVEYFAIYFPGSEPLPAVAAQGRPRPPQRMRGKGKSYGGGDVKAGKKHMIHLVDKCTPTEYPRKAMSSICWPMSTFPNIFQINISNVPNFKCKCLFLKSKSFGIMLLPQPPPRWWFCGLEPSRILKGQNIFFYFFNICLTVSHWLDKSVFHHICIGVSSGCSSHIQGHQGQKNHLITIILQNVDTFIFMATSIPQIQICTKRSIGLTNKMGTRIFLQVLMLAAR